MSHKQSAVELAKFVDKGVHVKLAGGREGTHETKRNETRRRRRRTYRQRQRGRERGSPRCPWWGKVLLGKWVEVRGGCGS